MKYHPILKLLAILLAACALVTCFFGIFGTILASQEDLYTRDLEDWKVGQMEQTANLLAIQLLDRYAAKALGSCSDETLSRIGYGFTEDGLSIRTGLTPDSWDHTITDMAGNCVERSRSQLPEQADVCTYSFVMQTVYPVEVPAEDAPAYDDSMYTHRNFYEIGGKQVYLYFYETAEYVVTVRILSDAVADYAPLSMKQVSNLYHMRYGFIVLFLGGLLMFVLCAVYLCFAAGRSSSGDTLRPGGFNRLPLDLYFAGAGLMCMGGVYLGCAALNEWLYENGNMDYGILALGAAIFLVAAIIGVSFCFACAAQFKMKDGWWWKRTLIGRFLRFCFRCLRALLRLLPLIWQWLLTGAAMGFFTLLFWALATVGISFWLLPFFLCLLGDIAIVCYGGYAFGALQKGARRMAAGDLEAKIPTRYLMGAFLTHAQYLNSIADATTIAAQKLTRSERMKTELIANVSHDIKTPLTSIVNYVDLLEKPHTPEEGAQYLEVLSRQSQRLKKLTEDLVEVSKASTGNINAEPAPMDLTEAVRQALGEFADKLAQCNLTPVFTPPEQAAMVMADGRITWRVLSNLLGNIVKYALPGTRVYIDIRNFDNKFSLSLKNISREELNICADELTERFVRGDISRNTEGSGLGLHIAKSLMETQKGQLNLLVDGDLFKVTLTFIAS